MSFDPDSYKKHEFVAHSTGVNCLTLGPNSNQILATGGEDCKVNIWRVSNVGNVWSLGNNKSSIESLCFDNEEQYIVSGALNGSLKIFDLGEGKLARTLLGHQVNICSLAYHPFGEFIVSGSIDTTMKVWDIRNKSCIQTYTGHEKEVTCVRFSPDGRWVASSAKDGQLFIWDLIAGKIINSIRMQPTLTYITNFEFNPAEFLLAGVTSGRSVKIWDLESMEQIGYTSPEPTPIRAMSFSNQGKALCTATGDSLKVWEWDPIGMRSSAVVGWDRISEIRVSPDNQLTGGSFYSNFVSVWEADLDRLSTQSVSQSKDKEEDRRQVKARGSRPVRSATPQAAEPKIDQDVQRAAGLVVQGHSAGQAKAGVATGPEVQWADGATPVGLVNSMSESFRTKQGGSGGSGGGQAKKADNGSDVRDDKSTVGSVKDPSAGPSPYLANMLPARESSRFVSQKPTSKSEDAPPLHMNKDRVGRDRKPPVPNQYSSPGGPTVGAVSSPAGLRAADDRDRERVGRERVVTGEKGGSVGARVGALVDGLGLGSGQSDSEERAEASLAEEAARLADVSVATTGTLQQRMSTLRGLHRAWDRADVEEVLTLLHELHDGAALDPHQVVVIVHFLEKADLRAGCVNLDACLDLLPLLCSLLLQDGNLKYENYVVAAMRAVAMLSISFGTLIRQTRSVSLAGKVDLSREERLQKCNFCHRMFSQIYTGLEAVRKKHKASTAIINLTDNVAQLLEDFL